MRGFFSLFLMISVTAPCLAADSTFSLRNGERVVFLGDALVERAQHYGYLETELLGRFPKIKLQFRNLGWSGDTVQGLSRAYFDPPAVGTKRQSEQVSTAKPTLLIVGYGMAESFNGPAGLPAFRGGMNELLDRISSGTRRVVLLSPIPHEDLGPPLPDPSGHNKSLAVYSKEIAAIAQKRSDTFVDLFKNLETKRRSEPRLPLTDNGIHLSEAGYWYLALEIQQQLNLPPEQILVRLDASRSKPVEQENTHVKVLKSNDREITFQQTDTKLPTPPSPLVEGKRLKHPQATAIQLQVRGLPAGNYSLFHKDRRIHSAPSSEWATGVVLNDTPQHRQVEQLRKLVHRKNRLFFAKYRPHNITYLLGFRRHEQGQNAKEIEQLAQLVTTAEAKIDAARIPVPYTFVLKRDSK